MGISKVRVIVLNRNWVRVGSIFLNLAVPEIFCFKHDVVASLIIIFIDNPDVDDIGDAIVVLFYCNAKIKLSHRDLLIYTIGLYGLHATALKRQSCQ